MNRTPIAAGDPVVYKRNPAFPSNPVTADGWQPAHVAFVHNQQLVDVDVAQGDAKVRVRFVPFLSDGDPDPATLMGCCQRSAVRA